MQNRFFTLLISGLVVAAISLLQPQVSPVKLSQVEKPSFEADVKEGGKIPKRDRMDLAIEHEVKMTKDPATGEVPRERLLAAKRYADMLRADNPRGPIAGVTWSERGPDRVGGRTRAIMVDPNDGTGNTLWAGSVGGGVWKTTNINNATPNWAPVNDLFGNLAVTALAYDPSNTQIMYFGTGEGYFNLDAIQGLGIWKSTNGGTSWAQLASTNNANFYYTQKIVVTSTGIILAATSSGVRRSTDGGTTWAKVLGTGLGITGAVSNFSYDIEIAANGDVYASLDGSIHKSVNNGANWAAAQTVPITISRVELACAPSDANYVFALCENGSSVSGILRTTNGGTTWVARTEPDDLDPGIPATDFSRGQAWYDLAIAVDPGNRDRLYVGGVDLFLSTDGAGTWTQVAHWYGGFSQQYVHADQHIILYQPGSSAVCYFGNDGGVYRSANANAATPTISDRNINYRVTQFYGCAIHPTAATEYFLAGAQDNGSQQFNSLGIDNTVEVTGGDGAFCHIDQDQPQYQFTSYVYNDYYRSTNSGSTWTNVTSGGGQFINPTDYDNVNNRMYCARNNNEYLRWDNPQTGSTFTTVAVAGFGGQVSAVMVSPNTANRVFFGIDNGDVFRLDNAHTASPTVTNISTGLPGGYVSCVEVQTGDDNHLLVTYSNYGVNSVWESINGGTSWTSVEGNVPDMPVRWAMFSPNNSDHAMIATELGVWSTDNLNGGSTNWGPSNSGLANVRVDMLQWRSSDKIVIAATHGRGLYSTSVFASPSAQFSADKTLTYTTKNVTFTDGSYAATTWSWDFGDGSPLSTVQNPVHAYSAAGRYSVTLTINGGASTLTKTNYIHVLPDRGTPYAPANGGNYEVNIDDFDQINTAGTPWERGLSAVAGKNGSVSPSNVWVTGITGNYVDNSYSTLWGPSFNFTAAGTYTLRFWSRFNCENQYDGFNVEYTLNKGDTWTVLGTAGAGWYNFANGAGGTAFPAGVPFFTGSNGAWVQYTRDVSAFAGNPNVAFRFVFATDVGVVGPGIAIDDFEILGPSNPAGGLPVVASPLTGRWSNDDVVLDWVSYLETDNRGFNIERSADGIFFENIGFVISQGNNSQEQAYQFTDRSPGGDIVWYRYRQEDFNGSTTLSNTVMLTRRGAGQMEVYPNPFRESLGLRFDQTIKGNLSLSLLNLSGQKVFEQFRPDFEGNEVKIDLGALGLTSGVYFLKVSCGEFYRTTKVMKQ